MHAGLCVSTVYLWSRSQAQSYTLHDQRTVIGEGAGEGHFIECTHTPDILFYTIKRLECIRNKPTFDTLIYIISSVGFPAPLSVKSCKLYREWVWYTLFLQLHPGLDHPDGVHQRVCNKSWEEQKVQSDSVWHSIWRCWERSETAHMQSRSPATPADDMCTAPLLGTNSPLKISLDFEYAAK